MSTTALAANRPQSQRFRREYREWLIFLAFVAPNLVLLAIFSFWPLIQNIALSFTDWDEISPVKRFVGLDNWLSVKLKALGGVVHALEPGSNYVAWHSRAWCGRMVGPTRIRTSPSIFKSQMQ